MSAQEAAFILFAGIAIMGFVASLGLIIYRLFGGE